MMEYALRLLPNGGWVKIDRDPAELYTHWRKTPMTQRRPHFRARGYDGNWDRLAREFKARCPICLGCWMYGLREPTTVVDHIVPLVSDRSRLLDVSNIQPSCDWHHDVCKRHLELHWRLGRMPETALRLDSPQAIAHTFNYFPVPIDISGYPCFELKRCYAPYPFA